MFTYDAFICVSNATKEACIKRGFPMEKLHVVSNGVDGNEALTPSFDDIKTTMYDKINLDYKNKKIILALGRPVRRKGFSWFVAEVMPLLDNNYVFLHIGHIDHSSSFWLKLLPKTMLNNLELLMGLTNDSTHLLSLSSRSDRVKLCGKLTDLERDFWIHQASVVVLPNIHVDGDMEGFGLVALEAAVRRKTVLAACLEGITDAIHDGKNGFLVISGDATAWTSRIKNLCDGNNLFNDESRTYTVTNFSWDKMVLNYQKIFHKLM
ncbi:MAG: glycosyltransferase family 4 protein [Saprospiraceae bacterium]|nr:glycosyltransferase family 4 protein [Saprospiraceae bacterium]